MNKLAKGALLSMALSVGLALSSPVLSGQSQKEFFSGKQVQLIIGAGAGGGGDQYGRFLARYIGQHIPGRPTIVVVNMPGAGGMRAANYLQNVAPRDGTELTIMATGVPLSQAFGDSSVKFDLSEFNWIGNMSQSPNVIITSNATQVKTMKDAEEKEVAIGSTSPLSTSSMTALIADSVLSTKFKVVNGYNSGAAIDLAMEHGEVGGRAGVTWAELKAERPYWIAGNSINILAQMGLKRISELNKVPLLTEFATNSEGHAMLAFVSNLSVVARAVAIGPGVPEDRVAVLRHAFDETMHDPAVLAEAEKEHLDITPLSGEETSEVIGGIVHAKGSVIARMKALLND